MRYAMHLINIHKVMAMLALGLVLFAAGCEDGAVGPPGPAGTSGSPHAIKVLIAGAGSDTDMREMVIIAYRDHFFPLGSQIDWINLRSSTPPVSTFLAYDVVYTFSLNLYADPVLAGDRLADYVDAGGKVVITQFAYSIANIPGADKGPLKGRIMTTGYSPLTAGMPNGNLAEKKIDVSSLDFPLHPIFNFVHDDIIDFFAQGDFGDPGLDPTATLLAKDITGDNVVAINAAGNVMGLDMLGPWDYRDQVIGVAPYPEANQLIINCILWIAGAY
jgi:hypothetical protein